MSLAVRASALIFIIALCMFPAPGRTSEATAEQVSVRSAPPMAPDFILQDLKGKAVSLKDYRGKVVLLNFTTTWCPYCKKDLPNLKKFHESMQARKDFALLSIFVNESPKRVGIFAQKYALPYTVLVDNEALVARNYGVQGVPMKVVVDRNCTIACWQCVSAEDKVKELLKQK
jgi:peroxiredoxin